MPIQERGVLRVVEAIYSAADDPNRWVSVLADITRLLRSSHAALFVQNLRDGRATIGASVWDPPFMQQYVDHYAAINPWLGPQHRSKLHLGTCHTSPMLLPDTALERTEFYNDYLSKQDLHEMIGACVYQEGGVVGNVTILRSRQTSAFSDEEIATVQTLVPHITRSLQLYRHFSAVRGIGETFEEIVNQLTTGALILDDAGRVMSVNAAAERMAGMRDGFELRQSRLTFSSSGVRSEFDRLFRDAALASVTSSSRGGGAMLLQRPSGRAPLEFLVSSARAKSTFLRESPPAVIVFIHDSGEAPKDKRALWRVLHGFTMMESVIASRVVHGHSLPEIAAFLGITVNTVKTHMKSIYTKTETNRQSQLVGRLTTGVGTFAMA